MKVVRYIAVATLAAGIVVGAIAVATGGAEDIRRYLRMRMM
jgi:hypothetical protein